MLIDKKRYNVLPCPFCGSDKIMMTKGYNPPLMRMYVYCESCGARAKTMTGFDGYDNSGIFADALSVWNSRASKKLRVKEMDIVNYVEQVCNFPLSDLQKEFVREAYDSIKNGKKLFYLPARGQSRFSFEILYAIATIIVGVENNLVKGDAINVN